MSSPDLDVDVLDQVLCSVREHVFVVARDGRIVYANLPLAQAWLVDRAEMIGHTFTDIASPRESVAEFDRLRDSVFASGQQARMLVSVAYRTLGRRDMDLTLSPIFEPGSLAVRLAFGVAADVTCATADSSTPEPRPESNHLSERRREVLTLVAQGYANKEIACALGISVRTVESHRRSIAAQLQLATRGDFFRYAKDEGYV